MDQNLKAWIDNLLQQQERVLVALDGPCTAGKTTLAAQLQRHYGCNVFHMDDFFLRPHQRTPERLAQPGGNVDYERFSQEVLQPLQEGKTVVYRPFDCGRGCLSEERRVQPGRLTIVEGTYSQHPALAQAYDLRLFLAIGAELQRQRVEMRQAFLRERFLKEWIPMENAYFAAFSIREKSYGVREESGCFTRN